MTVTEHTTPAARIEFMRDYFAALQSVAFSCVRALPLPKAPAFRPLRLETESRVTFVR